METKNRIRKLILNNRENLLAEDCEYNSKVICTQLQSFEWYQKETHICVYMAIRNEVNLYNFIIQAWQDGKNIYVPKVDKDTMDFYKISDFSQLEKGCFGVQEPIPSAEKYVPAQKSIMLVPGVAFSTNGARIGYGKGYYDKYLAQYANLIHPIGVAYEMQIVDTIIPDRLDIQMKEIVTEKRKVVIYDKS